MATYQIGDRVQLLENTDRHGTIEAVSTLLRIRNGVCVRWDDGEMRAYFGAEVDKRISPISV